MRAIRQIFCRVLIGVVVLGADGAQAQTAMGQSTWTLDMGGGVKMDFVLIQPGTFMMGGNNNMEEQPVHQVTLTKPFYLGKYKVTQEQYQQSMGSNPFSPVVPSNPVFQTISYFPLPNDFCTNFAAKYGVAARLPTEAEWEYSARAGSTTEWFFGSSEYVGSTNVLAQYAWYNVNSGGNLHPVGQLKPNPWGLYDVYGDAWDCTMDYGGVNGWGYDSSTYNLNGSVTNPCLPEGHHRECRGGAYNSSAYQCDSICRSGSGYPNPCGWRVLVECPSNMLPAVSNGGASNIAIVSATLNGQLLSTGTSATAVSVYWGSADNGTNRVGWNHTANLGTFPAGPVSANVTGLTGGTTYYYRFSASNWTGMVWADPAAQFTTASPPTINNGSGAMSITPMSAQLTGNLTAGGSAGITVYWGTGDGGTTPSNWQHVNSLGTLSLGTFSCNIGGLNPSTAYSYRCFASNVAGSVWASSTASFQTAPTLANGWAYGMKIIFTGYNKAETLTNFPVLVVFGTNIANFSYSQFQSSNGWDLSFAASNEATTLNYEVDQWTTNGSSYVWVQVPTISSSNDYIWAYWGNTAAAFAPAACATNGSTWSGSYVAVLHLNNTNAIGNFADSTAGHCDGTNNATTSLAGEIGNARYFNGSTANINCGDRTNYNNANGITNCVTIEMWANVGNAASGDNFMASRDPAANNFEIGLFQQNGVGAKPEFYVMGNSLRTAGIINLGQWYYISATLNTVAQDQRIYLNGALSAETALGSHLPTSGALCLGKGFGGAYFSGGLDEVRFSSVVRSPNWIWACYMNQASNSLFNSYQIQSGSSGGTTTHGIPYTWLQSYGIGNTNTSVETENPDGDSLNNLQEFIVGTDPTNPNSCFSVGITNVAGQIIVRVPSIQATGGGTRYYDMEYCTNLMAGAWQPATGYTNIIGNGSIIACTNVTPEQAKFYRVKARLQ
jgi:formylglycine-generating enzyme required for sulfatase activity